MGNVTQSDSNNLNYFDKKNRVDSPDEINDLTIISATGDKIVKKHCENCQETITGTKKVVLDKFSQHIRIKHLNGLNVEIKPTSEKKSDDSEEKSMSKKCEICKQMISINDGMENYGEHIRSCQIYAVFFKKTSNGFECRHCSEKQSKREKIYD